MLITDFDALRGAVEPILLGDVCVAGIDTETTEIKDDRFTPLGTDSRIAGFSVSYDLAEAEVDLYAAVRHAPYDWRRRKDLIERDRAQFYGSGKNQKPRRFTGAEWAGILADEGVTDGGTWAPGMDPNLPLDEVVDLWKELFAVAGVIWRAHNWPFDAKMFMADGVVPPWERIEDTQVRSVFTDERPLDAYDEEAENWVHQGHGLKHLGEEYLGIPAEAQALLKEAMEVLKCKCFAHLPLRRIIAPYGWMDTRLCLNLGRHIDGRRLSSDPKIRELIAAHHREIRRVVEMEHRGIRVDVAEADRRAEAKRQEQGRLRVRAQQAAGAVVPLDSPKELEGMIYDRFGMPLYRDQRNTRKATLKQVRAKMAAGKGLAAGSELTYDRAVELLDTVLDYRAATKELTAFYEPLVNFGGEEGIIYAILNMLAARTTRYSAAKPNIQQMPKPKKGRELESVRALFKPRDGHVLLPLDYSTQELRVAAHYARAIPSVFEHRFTWRCTLERRGDCKGKPPHGKNEVHVGYRSDFSRAPERMGLVDGFMTGNRDYDPHAIMVVRCNELAIEIDRGTGKGANFALIYGAGIWKLAEILDCSYDMAKRIFEVFWNVAYPELGRVKEFIAERLRHHGPSTRYSHQDFIRTIHGGAVFLEGAHKGFNYIVQRSCREILLYAILAVTEYLEREAPDYRLLFPVHDELVIEAPADSVDRGVVRKIARLMVEAGSASTIPMIVDPAVCRENWALKEDLGAEWGWNGVTDVQEAA